jgi:membrane protease YdiL (CAAX protease family)
MIENIFLPENLRFSIALLWSVVGFGSYYFLSQSSKCSRRVGSICKILDQQGNKVALQRMWGLLFLGVISALIILVLPGISLKAYGLNFRFLAAPPWWTWLLLALIPVMNYFAAQKTSNLEQYPQIRARQWNRGVISVSAMSWVLFLVGYEFLFRGFLLHASLEVMSAGPAIALNSAIYGFAHFYKGPGETFGAIPVGILLCYLTLVTGNIWCAVLIHSVMSLSNEWFSLRFHPEMEILKAR